MSVTPKDQKASRETFLLLANNERLLERPDIEGFEYMIEMLQDLGYTDSEGHGLPYSEIQSYCSLVGVELSSWDASTLKKLSSDFAVQLQKRDMNDETPYKH